MTTPSSRPQPRMPFTGLIQASARAAAVKRSARNSAGGTLVSDSFITTKVVPQMRVTSSSRTMPVARVKPASSHPLQVGVAHQFVVIKREHLARFFGAQAVAARRLADRLLEPGMQLRRFVAHVLDHPPRLLAVDEQLQLPAVIIDPDVRLVDPAEQVVGHAENVP